MKKISYLVFMLVLFTSNSCDDDSVEIKLTSGFCGHSFIIFMNSEMTNDLTLNEKGVLYASKKDFFSNRKYKEIIITQDGIEVNKDCINIMQGIHSYGIENNKIEYIYIYKKCSKEDSPSLPIVNLLFCDFIKVRKIERLSKNICD